MFQSCPPLSTISWMHPSPSSWAFISEMRPVPLVEVDHYPHSAVKPISASLISITIEVNIHSLLILTLHILRPTQNSNNWVPLYVSFAKLFCDSSHSLLLPFFVSPVAVPEDLPPFPHRHELILELAKVLRAHSIPLGNLNKNSSSSPYGAGPTPTPATPTSTSSSPRIRRAHPRGSHGRKNSSDSTTGSPYDSGMDSSNEGEGGGGGASQINNISSSMSASYHSSLSQPTLGTTPTKTKRTKGGAEQGLPSSSMLGWVGGVLGSGLHSGGVEGEEESLSDLYHRNLKLNVALREIFANRFLHMFASYDHFLSQPNEVGVVI